MTKQKCKECKGYGFTNYGKSRAIQTNCPSCHGTGEEPKKVLTAIREAMPKKPTARKSDGSCINTNKELWREREGDFYSDSIFVTKEGSIGINCGGNVKIMPVRKWFESIQPKPTPDDKLLADLMDKAQDINELSKLLLAELWDMCRFHPQVLAGAYGDS